MSPLKSTFGAASAFGWIPRVTFTPLTNVEFTVWAGGSNSGPGGQVVKKTAQTLSVPTAYTVEVGAANSLSQIYATGFSAVQATVSATSSSNVVDGVTTTYSTSGNNYSMPAGYQYQGGGPMGYGLYYNGNQIDVIGGKPGAGGNGGNALNSFPYSYYGGAGGNGFSVTSTGLANFPSNSVGYGGPGYASPSSNFYDYYYSYYDPYYGFSYWVYGGDGFINGINGGIANSGANAGNGFGAGIVQAGSGGFTMRYPDSQKQLTSTTGTVVYLQSGGYHNYFWKSTGSFTV